MENSPQVEKQSNGKSELPNYNYVIEKAASFNSRILAERKMRMPFIDSHTGVAQNNSWLWWKARDRMEATNAYQICTYPQRRWRKKKRPYTPEERNEHSVIESTSTKVGEQGVEDSDMIMKHGFEKWYDDYDLMNELNEAGEDDRVSDISDFEDQLKGRKKKKAGGGGGGGRGRKKKTQEEIEEKILMEKPYACELCGARYKTRPGLTYHYNHFHNGEPEPVALSPKPSEPTGKPQVQDFCDFCLGDASENKKTKKPEQLFSCSVCGHSGHPSCLQFTPNMIVSVKRYPWQCIECKSCGLCGTSDNDDQLLFCDDCDRGYHMYCLSPPLTEPPEGSWSCHLCIEEFHGGKNPIVMASVL